jgi:hypothetical protein
MSVLAVMATGAHVLAYTSPVLAEQARLKRVAAAETERSIVANPPPAASDGLPVPALAGGIVLAFALGLGAGQVHRRRRRTVQPRPSRGARRAAAHAPPARPAPAPPEPAAPAAPVVVAPPVAPPAPVPPPPAPRRPRPRVVVPPPTAAPPPKPPRPLEPFDLFGREPRPFPDAHPPLAEAPEVPRPQDVDPALHERVVPPLEHAPEALRPPRPKRPSAPARPSAPTPPRRPAAPAPEMPDVTPARRFARLVPWPEEAAALWTCEIDWKAGYRKSNFRAMAEPPGAGKRRQIGESPSVRWTLMSDPEPPTPELVASVRLLIGALEAAGWERIGPGGPWYAQRFLWRRSGEPTAVAVPVPDSAQTVEPPPR